MYKKFIIILLTIIFNNVLFAQQIIVNGEHINCEDNFQIIHVWTHYENKAQIEDVIKNNYKISSIRKQFETPNIKSLDSNNKLEFVLYELVSLRNLDERSAKKMKDSIDHLSFVSYSTFNNLIENHNEIYFSNQIYVKLKNESDIDKLLVEAIKFKLKVIGSNTFMPLWYTLYCDKFSDGDAIEISDKIFQTSLFDKSEPDIRNIYFSNCSNEPLFLDQWALNNFGQNSGTSGIDINICKAWEISKGNENVVTAVFDDGIELAHPDLSAGIKGINFNVMNGATPSQSPFGIHGTQCAGIIGAQENNIGINGIAPNSKIMSISMDFFGNLTSQHIANGISHAWSKGACIISNSWTASVNEPKSNLIIDAISDALNKGRNNLGTVVVFISGNDNRTDAQFPGNIDERIICVGGVDKCGYRAGRIDIVPNSCDPWCSTCHPGSSFGDPLDIVAGATNISTTDLTGAAGDDASDYNSSFSGTSAAGPMVAGVASLMLSVNPCLTEKNVHKIICNSGQKLSNYTFVNKAARSSLGTWNAEVGHGLINAEFCVAKASTYYLQNNNETGNKNFLFSRIFAGKEVDFENIFGYYTIGTTANVIFRATKTIKLSNGFNTQNGCRFKAKIEPNASCALWTAANFRQLQNSTSTIEKPNNTESNNTKITVYPNPSSKILKIRFELNESSLLKFELFDFQGNLLISNSKTLGKGIFEEYLENFEFLTNSIYLLKITVGNTVNSFKIEKHE
jgi:subtilisin family serine protease